MATKLLKRCPACGGDLKITVLTCADCKLELRGEFEPEREHFPGLTDEHRKILTAFLENAEHRELLRVFLEKEGRIGEVQEELQLSYGMTKKKLEELRLAMGFEKAEKTENREIIDMRAFQVNERSVQASERVKSKLKEANGQATVTSYSGKHYEIWAMPDGKSFGCDALGAATLTWDVLDVVCNLLERNGGAAKKGIGRAPLGSPSCGLDTVAGVILREYYGVSVGGSGFDPSFAVIAILSWANITSNERGEVRLTAEYKALLRNAEN